MLLIFGGLPASGKSTISKRVAQELSGVYIRVDTIEQTLRDSGLGNIYSEGYEIAYKIAAENLSLGMPVVADSVNSVGITRDAWRLIAETANVPFLEIEIICSDQEEHKRRVETRSVDVDQSARVSWVDVLTRDYEPWLRAHVVIDTAGVSPGQSFDTLAEIIAKMPRQGRIGAW